MWRDLGFIIFGCIIWEFMGQLIKIIFLTMVAEVDNAWRNYRGLRKRDWDAIICRVR